MRAVLFAWLIAVGGLTYGDEPATLDSLIERRIALHAKLRDENSKVAADDPVGKELAPLEKRIGQEWVDFLKHVRTLSDDQVKVQVLRLELLDELRSTYFKLEKAEKPEEIKSIQSELAGWKKELEELEQLAAKVSPNPKTIEDVLAMKTSLSFDNLSLEFAMRDLAKQASERAKGVDFGIRILGADLQLDGITRNMSIRDFDQKDKSVGEILTALVLKSSVIRDPASEDQKLVWVVGPDPDNPGKKVVLITTRKKVKERNDTLPGVFVEKKK